MMFMYSAISEGKDQPAFMSSLQQERGGHFKTFRFILHKNLD
jgi:hypothetical protein